jgi:hypothetical protein
MRAFFAEESIVKCGPVFCFVAFLALFAPAAAQDSLQGLAPADEYFGRYNLSVLGIANHIRDAGLRIDAGDDARTMLSGPLSFVNDAVKAWEAQYPADPWIAKDLLALEGVYLRIPTDEGFRLASQTETWLITDYPNTTYASRGRTQLAEATLPAPVQRQQAPAIPSYAMAWTRYAALRAPLAPR